MLNTIAQSATGVFGIQQMEEREREEEKKRKRKEQQKDTVFPHSIYNR